MALPTVIIPGYLAGAAPYEPMVADLRQQGIDAVVVPLTRSSWLPTLGGRSVQPILAAIDGTVKRLKAEFGCDRLNLVGHSAGGWIARIYLGEKPYDIHAADQNRPNCWNGRQHIHTLVTLGTPHISQERWTRRNLDFVNQTYPGAFLDSVRYVCIASKAVYGQRWRTWFTYNSYQLTSGEGATWGDGITPIAAAHLDGAENLTLENVYHSPKPGAAWYGSESIVSQWAKYLH